MNLDPYLQNIIKSHIIGHCVCVCVFCDITLMLKISEESSTDEMQIKSLFMNRYELPCLNRKLDAELSNSN